MIIEDEDTCTHEEFYLGRCVACGESDGREFDPDDQPRIKAASEMSGCQNRGWFHDGSEEAEAQAQGRAVRPCPHHDGSNR